MEAGILPPARRILNVFYLHGFASSAASSKAMYFRERLARGGVALDCPDFNQPDFSTLTVTRMLDQLAAAIAPLPPAPVALIGSSLGALVAYHAAQRSGEARARGAADPHPIDRLILLAPALDLAASLTASLGADKLAEWRRTDRLEVFHYAYGEPRDVRYALYEDARQFDPFTTTLDVPILIFQGRRDQAVDPAMVERFAGGRPNVTLTLLDDDHQLLGSLDAIWQRSAAFLGFADEH